MIPAPARELTVEEEAALADVQASVIARRLDELGPRGELLVRDDAMLLIRDQDRWRRWLDRFGYRVTRRAGTGGWTVRRAG